MVGVPATAGLDQPSLLHGKEGGQTAFVNVLSALEGTEGEGIASGLEAGRHFRDDEAGLDGCVLDGACFHAVQEEEPLLFVCLVELEPLTRNADKVSRAPPSSLRHS